MHIPCYAQASAAPRSKPQHVRDEAKRVDELLRLSAQSRLTGPEANAREALRAAPSSYYYYYDYYA